MKIIKYLLSFFKPLSITDSKFTIDDIVEIESLKEWRQPNYIRGQRITHGKIVKIMPISRTSSKNIYIYLVEFSSPSMDIKEFWFTENNLFFYNIEDKRDYKLKQLLK